MTNNEMIQAALDVRENAYAKYSKFYVGAAVRTSSGKIFSGCNVENASFSLTLCAERNALTSAIAAGEQSFTHLVVASENGVSPCGACRQVIWELCGDIPITIVDARGKSRETSSRALLPEAFDENDLDL
jgi:cytidine deaminase